jgi:hypothetical protein
MKKIKANEVSAAQSVDKINDLLKLIPRTETIANLTCIVNILAGSTIESTSSFVKHLQTNNKQGLILLLKESTISYYLGTNYTFFLTRNKTGVLYITINKRLVEDDLSSDRSKIMAAASALNAIGSTPSHDSHRLNHTERSDRPKRISKRSAPVETPEMIKQDQIRVTTAERLRSMKDETSDLLEVEVWSQKQPATSVSSSPLSHTSTETTSMKSQA